VNGIPNGDAVMEQLDYCEENLIRVNRKDGSFPILSTGGIFLFKCKVSFQNFRKYILSNTKYGSSAIQSNFKEGCSIIQSNFKEGCSIIQSNFKEARTALSSYNQGVKELIHFYRNKKHHNYSLLMKFTKVLLEETSRGIYLVVKQAGKGIYLVARQAGKGIYIVAKLAGNGIYLVAKLAVKGITSPVTKTVMHLKNMISPLYPKLHTNSCGDFTMMTKEKWHSLRGYPEYEIFSFNIDSIILQMAYEDGLSEKILKGSLRMYHMEHSAGWTPESGKKLIKRLKDTGVPFFSFKEFGQLASKMHKKKSPMISNKEGWGLGSETLPEVCIN